jgi:formylglycine-generating enzyme required for sulfatase activity
MPARKGNEVRAVATALAAAALAVAALGCARSGSRTAAPMVPVPAGEFEMGCTDNLGGCMEGGMDLPAHAVVLSAFEIDKTEVTQAAYAACVVAGACTRPSGRRYTPDRTPTFPVTEVSWEQAVRYCAWVGKRLPTEAEWEKTARGTDARMYPWGDAAPTCALATFEGCGDGPRPVGSTPAGASPYGALDLAGNVQEWVADFYSSTDYAAGPARDPGGPNRGNSGHSVRGGGYRYDAWHLRSAVRLWDPGAPADDLGFRCARSL